MTVHHAETSDPIIDRIEEIAATIPGWSPVDQLHSLYVLAVGTSHLEGDVVEVGSWCGRASAVLGLAAQLGANPGREEKVHCIDPFPSKSDWRQNEDGTYSFEMTIDGQTVIGYTEHTVWQEPFEWDMLPLYEENPSLLDRFEQNVTAAGVREFVAPFRGTVSSFLAGARDEFRCRLAFVDGGHDYDAVCADIRELTPRLVPGAWLCFDDAFTSYDGVDRAIRDLVIANGAFDQCHQMTRKMFVARRAPTGSPPKG